jgi:hypothetical protein
MTDDAPKGIDGRWVLAGFLLLAVAALSGVYVMNRDVERKAREAKELEAKLGRQVGPEDSPKHRAKMERQRKAAE